MFSGFFILFLFLRVLTSAILRFWFKLPKIRMVGLERRYIVAIRKHVTTEDLKKKLRIDNQFNAEK